MFIYVMLLVNACLIVAWPGGNCGCASRLLLWQNFLGLRKPTVCHARVFSMLSFASCEQAQE